MRRSRLEHKVMYIIGAHASDSNKFEIMLDEPTDMDSSFDVWPTQTGFCAKLRSATGVDPDAIWQSYSWAEHADDVTAECYVPFDELLQTGASTTDA